MNRYPNAADHDLIVVQRSLERLRELQEEQKGLIWPVFIVFPVTAALFFGALVLALVSIKWVYYWQFFDMDHSYSLIRSWAYCGGLFGLFCAFVDACLSSSQRKTYHDYIKKHGTEAALVKRIEELKHQINNPADRNLTDEVASPTPRSM